MRPLISRTHTVLALALACALSLTIALSLPGVARADNPKVEPRLAALADKKSKNDDVAIILRGSDTSKLFRKFAKKGEELPLVGAVATTVKVKDLDKLAADPDVSYVLADPPVHSEGSPIDPSSLVSAHTIVDRAPLAWLQGYDGSGVGIAVIDTGVAPIADFSGRLVQVSMPGQPWAVDDVFGHGSIVAGIAAGRGGDGRFMGVAPGATIYALNVNNPAGANSSDVVSALQWVFLNAHTYNIRVVNLSLGENLAGSYLQSTLDLAVERLWAAGIAVVVSSGNGGPGAIDFAPANDPLAIAVGATDMNSTLTASDDVVASFSASGVTSNGFTKPELVAPGRLVTSVLVPGTTLDLLAPLGNRVAPGYGRISGTSFAAPQVAGAAAVLFQKHPEWSPDQVKSAIVQKARSIAAGQTSRTLDVNGSLGVGTPAPANQGVLALVCAPGSTCLPDNGVSTASSSWNSSSWNSSSWNSSSWNSSSWNSSSWNMATFSSSSWNSSSWNSSSWNSSSWNSSSWNAASWDNPAAEPAILDPSTADPVDPPTLP